jgi:feruloyl esterase
MKKCALFIVCLFLVSVAVNDASAKEDWHGRHHGRYKMAVGGPPVIECKSEVFEAAFRYTDTAITGVTEGSDPAHCIVRGYMNDRIGPVDGKPYAIGFEMRLPTDWKGRFFYQANGGVDGYVAPAYGNILGGGPTSNGLLKGFAVISSDAGHPARSADFGLDPQARLDYGYNAVAELTPMAKRLIKAFYGKFPDTSYIVGSSNGGRHAMVAASRYADQYDGFLAGAPGFNLPKAAVAQLWGVQQYATISDYGSGDPFCGQRVPLVPAERPDIKTSFSAEDTALVSDEILEKCDTLDGTDDDWVGDPLACQDEFNINRDIPTCESPGDTDCLRYGQKSVLARVHAGAMNSLGEALYTDFLWDPGIRASAWRTWKFCNSISDRDPVAVGYIFTTPPQYPLDGTTNLEYALNWNDEGFDADRDAPLIYATEGIYTESAMSFMTPPDQLMKQLRARKGKLMVVHGAADPVFSVADTVDWYDALSARYKKHTQDFARLFIVPGMSHSSGGPACDQFDLVDALVDWVEKGKKPDAITATARTSNPEVPATWAPDRTRPLCAYPAVPMYNGTGNVEDASSFSCVTP